MSKVCPKCGREFGNSSIKCPICNLKLEEFGIKRNINGNANIKSNGQYVGFKETKASNTTNGKENPMQNIGVDENGVLKMKGYPVAVAIGMFCVGAIAISVLSFYTACVIATTIILTVLLTNSQKDDIRKTTYNEKIIYEGREKVIKKIKCPTCGNKELGYQRVNDSALTMVHGKKRRFSTTSISSSQYAICSNCGTDFRVIRKTTPFINLIVSFAVSFVVCSIVNLIWIFVTI